MSFVISSGVVIPDVPSLDAVSYLIPYMCGIVSRRHSFSSGPILGAHPKLVVRIYRQRLCDCVLDWEYMLLGMDHTSPPLLQCLELDQGVTVTLRVHVLCRYLSVVVNICCHRLSHCGLDWECMLLEWIGLHSPRFVCDCDIESSRACYRSCSE